MAIVRTEHGQPLNQCNKCGKTWSERRQSTMKGGSKVCPSCYTTAWNKEKDNNINELKTEMMTRGQRKIVLKVYTCKICGHEWHPRKEQKPRSCPSCRSIRWEKGK